MLSAGGVLIEGGLSRYAAYGLPPHANWKAVAFGLVMLGTGAALFRPAFFMRGKLK